MKRLWKGVKRFMKNTTEKTVTAVNNFLKDNENMRKLGVMVICAGVGLVVASHINV